ncbi:hypothetical protein GCM10011297_21900 [Bacterioplanes sanyensis]|nr:hypothetical protein GCM10011297_21900 [Bacterioplanes sanyensis]
MAVYGSMIAFKVMSYWERAHHSAVHCMLSNGRLNRTMANGISANKVGGREQGNL